MNTGQQRLKTEEQPKKGDLGAKSVKEAKMRSI